MYLTKYLTAKGDNEALIQHTEVSEKDHTFEKLIVDLLVDMPDNYVFFILNKTSRYNSPSIGLIQRVNRKVVVYGGAVSA